MTVDPISPGQIQPSQTGKTSDTNGGEHARTKEGTAAAGQEIVKQDKVEFSPAAQELHELTDAEQIETNTLPPERLKEVIRRVEEGFYDSPDVIDEVAKRASEDL
jgi:hypothetical protein